MRKMTLTGVILAGVTAASAAHAQTDPMDVWSVAGESRDYTIFVSQGSVGGPVTARTALGMNALKAPNAEGVAAQQTQYVFDCGRKRFTATTLIFVMADTLQKFEQPGPNEEKRWRDDQVAQSVGELACGDAWTVQTFNGMEAAFAEAAR